MTFPEFDFEGALTLAQRLVQLADETQIISDARAAKRDVAHDQWKGAYGDDHRNRGQAADEQVIPTVAALRETADEWASQWVQAVVDTNQAAFEEADKEMQERNQTRLSQHNASVSHHYSMSAAASRALAQDPPYYLYVPPHPGPFEFGEVQPPPEAPSTPKADNFTASAAPFITYSLEGIDMNWRPTSSPPS